MRRTFPLQVLLAAGLIVMAGCAGKSSPPQAGNTTGEKVDKSRDESYAKVSPDKPPSTAAEKWDYDIMPTPAPSARPHHRLNEIAFKENDASLDAEGTAVCREIARYLKETAVDRALVVGFAHHREKDPTLGLRRAEAVKRSLVSQGVKGDRLEVASYGTHFSSPSATDALQRKQPQAVEVWVLSK
jgi:outer membrane protein OmpA-like peptidoglycan-associated protein